jgi:hypothetical protein
LVKDLDFAPNMNKTVLADNEADHLETGFSHFESLIVLCKKKILLKTKKGILLAFFRQLFIIFD